MVDTVAGANQFPAQNPFGRAMGGVAKNIAVGAVRGWGADKIKEKTLADYNTAMGVATDQPAPNGLVAGAMRPTLMDQQKVTPRRSPLDETRVATKQPPQMSDPFPAQQVAGQNQVALDDLANQQDTPHQTGYNPDNKQVQTVTATNWDMNDNQLVENRTKGIIDSNSLLMQQAEARAKQQMQGRGLVNSSMATTAGQSAVMDKAVDIAGRDAQTMANQAQFNANAANQVNVANADQTNRWNLQDLEKNWQGGENAIERTFKTDERLGAQTFDTEKMKGDQAWRTGERLSGQEFDTEQMKSDQTWRSGERIANNEFSAGEGKLNRDSASADRNSAASMASADRAANREMQMLQFKDNAEQRKVDREIQQQQFTSNQEQRTLDRNVQIEQNKDNSTQRALDREARTDEYKFNAETQKEVRETEYKYQKDLNNNSAIDKQYGIYTDEMYQIDTNKDLSAEAKDALKSTAREKFEGFADIKGMDLQLTDLTSNKGMDLPLTDLTPTKP